MNSAYVDGYIASSITVENPDIFGVIDEFDSEHNSSHKRRWRRNWSYCLLWRMEGEEDIHIQYFDADFNKVGEEMSDSYGSSEFFKVFLTDDSDGTITGEANGELHKRKR